MNYVEPIRERNKVSQIKKNAWKTGVAKTFFFQDNFDVLIGMGEWK
jgi:hypothetical protein